MLAIAEDGDNTRDELIDRVDWLERRLTRQIAAREQAETLLEQKGRELYEANRRLAQINTDLEQRVRDRTLELETERRNALELAQRDVLTGLPNRRMFRECLQASLRAIRKSETLAVIYLDLDGFKAVNDTLGHGVGDDLLKAVGCRLQECIRNADVVARLGGDEFAIIHARSTESGAEALAERLVSCLQNPFQLQEHTVEIGTSVGIAVAMTDADTVDTLLRNADIALYRAKSSGRGTWRTFDPDMDLELQARRTLERDLRRALSSAEFEVFYQPLVDASRQTISGYEALLRWHHPSRGLVSPNEFIPVAEEIGLIRPIGTWVLERACADAACWAPDLRVAVNLSPVKFRNSSLVSDVEQALSKAGLSPDRLELEITESMLLQHTDETLAC